MHSLRQRQWLVVATLLVAVFVVFGGGFYTGGVFVLPLASYFHTTRARVSTLFAISGLTSAISSYFVGWLLDRFTIKWIMASCLGLCGLSMLFLSRAQDFSHLLVGYALLGTGLIAGTNLCAAFTISRSFQQARGKLLGLIFAGESAGGMVMTLIAAHVLVHYGHHQGWRVAYVALALPMLLVAVPIVLLCMRDLPVVNTAGRAQPQTAPPGLELAQALRTRSFWYLATAWFCSAFGFSAEIAHVIPSLVAGGFATAVAASFWSLALACKAAGQLGLGAIADWIGARVTWGACFIAGAIAILVLGAASPSHPISVLVYVLLGGPALGGTIVLAPVVQAYSLGVKRFGSIHGLLLVLSQIGFMVGPVITGWIFDLTHSYREGFAIIATLFALAAMAIFRCAPLSRLLPTEPLTQNAVIG
ncbi:MAG TPA: MFS transporter [Candidatus Binataceae bacterium]|nr:MFS transporter [Candidatus Binataceae bacterium]